MIVKVTPQAVRDTVVCHGFIRHNCDRDDPTAPALGSFLLDVELVVEGSAISSQLQRFLCRIVARRIWLQYRDVVDMMPADSRAVLVVFPT